MEGVRAISTRRAGIVLAVFAVLGIAVFAASLCLGRYEFSLGAVLSLLQGGADADTAREAQTSLSVLLEMRLPRVLAAACIGAMLATAGCAYQGLFRNPMVSPDILGASAGAGFGASLAILLSLGGFGIQVVAFAFGALAVGISYTLSQRVARGLSRVLVLVLCGMVTQQLFTAFTSAVKFVADPNSQLPEITFWLMGGLANVKVTSLPWLLAPLAIGLAILFAMRWKLNVMTMGDEEAAALGVDVGRVRLAVIAAATLVTSSAVSVAGMVGWVGLIIPHLARFLVGPDHRVLIPASFLMGGTFLMLVDDVCRVAYTTEIPISILTAVIGAPLFVYLIGKQARR